MLRDAAQAYIEVLLEKGGSVPVDEGVETGNMPVVTVTVKTSSAIRPLLTLTGVGGNVMKGLMLHSAAFNESMRSWPSSRQAC